MKETYLYKKLENRKVQCVTCAHFCSLSEKEKGKCGVRKNIDGNLYSLNYQKAVALNIDPIEKKPFFHFFPGSLSLSVGSAGCAFSCKNCQNWEISQRPKTTEDVEGEEVSPEKIIETAKKYRVPSISYTYTDPLAFFEYALDTMKIAKKGGFKNCFVSHGFMTPESRKEIIPHLDAINIDIKSFSEKFYQENCGARLNPVLETAEIMKKSNIWVEITTLAIPTLSDSEKMFEDIADFIYNKLGPETPWHISRFSGKISWKLNHLPETPQETMEKAYKIAKRKGLKYVYAGNFSGHRLETTYCLKCNTPLIARTGYSIDRYDERGACPKCQAPLEIVLE